MERPSESIHKILTVKVRSRDTARYPFDKVYLFKKELLPLAQKLSPNNLAFPIKGETKLNLALIPFDELVISTLGRTRYNTVLPGGVPPGTRVPGQGKRDRASNGGRPDCEPSGVPKALANTSPLISELMEHLVSTTEDDSWYQLVPILGTYRSGTTQRPAYLCSKRWVRNNSSRSRNWLARVSGRDPIMNTGISTTRIIPDSGSLTVAGEQHSPPCLCCTRLMNHMSGECELGGRTCLENMDFGNKSYFLEGLAISNRLQNSSVKEVMEWLLKAKTKEDGI